MSLTDGWVTWKYIWRVYQGKKGEDPYSTFFPNPKFLSRGVKWSYTQFRKVILIAKLRINYKMETQEANVRSLSVHKIGNKGSNKTIGSRNEKEGEFWEIFMN